MIVWGALRIDQGDLIKVTCFLFCFQDGANAWNSYRRAMFATGVRVCCVSLRDQARSIAYILRLRLFAGLSWRVFHYPATMARTSVAQQRGIKILSYLFIFNSCNFLHY